ncbi:MFS transporter [Candidimonas humi]|uniref:CynX/NimT family MFS transporter n=1 Tax=Candidimonas humi TaxID=683355 RepID=A0ABV8NSS2_9BURK|nr:MFS transporter [Candidimonas humi]MBV6303693.1 MFS transporter [Candidimonas humi]
MSSAPDKSATSPSLAQAHASRGAALVLLGISLMLIAFNLRPVFSSLSVLLPEIIRHTGLSSANAGYLTTLPVLCLGLFAPLAPGLAQRYGMERTLLGMLVLLAAGTALRGQGSISGLFIGSALAGAGIAVGNVLLPALVKRDFAGHTAGMMGLYTMALCGGAAAAAAFTLPLAHAMGDSWTAALAVWALPAAVVALVWAPQSLGSRGTRPRAPARRVRGLTRDPLAWQVTLFMGLQSALAYCVMGWLAPILRDRGLSGVTAGLVVSVSILIQVVVSLLVPPLAVRCKDQRLFNAALSAIAGLALLGLLFAPLSMVWMWAVIQGVGQGGLFAAALTVIVLRSPDSHVAAHLSGMAQSVGYVLAAIGPLLVGLLHGWTGSYSATSWLFIALSIGSGVNGWFAGRNRHVRIAAAAPKPTAP